MSHCSPTCGDGKLDKATEVCDIGNSQLANVLYGSSGLNPIQNPEYDSDKSTRGCVDQCKTIEDGYICPLDEVGECSNTCGDGFYQGEVASTKDGVKKVLKEADPAVKPVEYCDDGGTVSGDGCSRMCRLEDSTGRLDGNEWTCRHAFRSLEYEAPQFITKCTRNSRRRLEGEDGDGEGMAEDAAESQ